MEDSESDASVDDDAEEIVSDHSMKTSVAVNDEDITVQDSEQESELLSATCGIFLPPKVSNLLDSNVDDVDDILNCVYINEDGISAVDPVDESEVNPLALEGEKDPLNDEEEGQDNTLRNIKVESEELGIIDSEDFISDFQPISPTPDVTINNKSEQLLQNNGAHTPTAPEKNGYTVSLQPNVNLQKAYCEICGKEFKGDDRQAHKEKHMVHYFNDELFKKLPSKNESNEYECQEAGCHCSFSQMYNWIRHFGFHNLDELVSGYLQKHPESWVHQPENQKLYKLSDGRCIPSFPASKYKDFLTTSSTTFSSAKNLTDAQSSLFKSSLAPYMDPEGFVKNTPVTSAPGLSNPDLLNVLKTNLGGQKPVAFNNPNQPSKKFSRCGHCVNCRGVCNVGHVCLTMLPNSGKIKQDSNCQFKPCMSSKDGDQVPNPVISQASPTSGVNSSIRLASPYSNSIKTYRPASFPTIPKGSSTISTYSPKAFSASYQVMLANRGITRSPSSNSSLGLVNVDPSTSLPAIDKVYSQNQALHNVLSKSQAPTLKPYINLVKESSGKLTVANSILKNPNEVPDPKFWKIEREANFGKYIRRILTRVSDPTSLLPSTAAVEAAHTTPIPQQTTTLNQKHNIVIPAQYLTSPAPPGDDFSEKKFLSTNVKKNLIVPQNYIPVVTSPMFTLPKRQLLQNIVPSNVVNVTMTELTPVQYSLENSSASVTPGQLLYSSTTYKQPVQLYNTVYNGASPAVQPNSQNGTPINIQGQKCTIIPTSSDNKRPKNLGSYITFPNKIAQGASLLKGSYLSENSNKIFHVPLTKCAPPSAKLLPTAPPSLAMLESAKVVSTASATLSMVAHDKVLSAASPLAMGISAASQTDDDLDFESEYLDLLYEADRQLDKLEDRYRQIVENEVYLNLPATSPTADNSPDLLNLRSIFLQLKCDETFIEDIKCLVLDVVNEAVNKSESYKELDAAVGFLEEELVGDQLVYGGDGGGNQQLILEAQGGVEKLYDRVEGCCDEELDDEDTVVGVKEVTVEPDGGDARRDLLADTLDLVFFIEDLVDEIVSRALDISTNKPYATLKFNRRTQTEFAPALTSYHARDKCDIRIKRKRETEFEYDGDCSKMPRKRNRKSSDDGVVEESRDGYDMFAWFISDEKDNSPEDLGSIKRANAEHAIPSKLTNKSRRRKDIADVIYSWDFLYKPQNCEVATLKNAEVVYVDPDLRDYHRRVAPGVVAIMHENKKKKTDTPTEGAKEPKATKEDDSSSEEDNQGLACDEHMDDDDALGLPNTSTNIEDKCSDYIDTLQLPTSLYQSLMSCPDNGTSSENTDTLQPPTSLYQSLMSCPDNGISSANIDTLQPPMPVHKTQMTPQTFYNPGLGRQENNEYYTNMNKDDLVEGSLGTMFASLQRPKQPENSIEQCLPLYECIRKGSDVPDSVATDHVLDKPEHDYYVSSYILANRHKGFLGAKDYVNSMLEVFERSCPKYYKNLKLDYSLYENICMREFEYVQRQIKIWFLSNRRNRPIAHSLKELKWKLSNVLTNLYTKLMIEAHLRYQYKTCLYLLEAGASKTRKVRLDDCIDSVIRKSWLIRESKSRHFPRPDIWDPQTARCLHDHTYFQDYKTSRWNFRNPEQSIEQCAPELMIEEEEVIVIKEEPVQESDYDDPENPLELPEHVSGEDEGESGLFEDYAWDPNDFEMVDEEALKDLMNADDNHDTGEDFDSDEDTRPSGWKRKFAEDDNDYTPPGGHSKNYTPGGRTKNHSGKRDRKRKRGLSVTTSNSISESHKKLRKSLLIPRNEISEPVVKLVENNSDSGLKKKKLAERDSHSPLFEKKKSVERDTPGNPLLILRNELSEPVVKSVENNSDSRLKKKKIDERDSHSPQFEKKKSVERDTPGNPLPIHMKMIDGVCWDFRCYICKILPRAGKPNRSELYRHYTNYHFSTELKETYGHLNSCPICYMDFKRSKDKTLSDTARIGKAFQHMGQVHAGVEEFLPESARVPGSTTLKAQGFQPKEKVRPSTSTNPSNVRNKTLENMKTKNYRDSCEARAEPEDISQITEKIQKVDSKHHAKKSKIKKKKKSQDEDTADNLDTGKIVDVDELLESDSDSEPEIRRILESFKNPQPESFKNSQSESFQNFHDGNYGSGSFAEKTNCKRTKETTSDILKKPSGIPENSA